MLRFGLEHTGGNFTGGGNIFAFLTDSSLGELAFGPESLIIRADLDLGSLQCFAYFEIVREHFPRGAQGRRALPEVSLREQRKTKSPLTRRFAPQQLLDPVLCLT